LLKISTLPRLSNILTLRNLDANKKAMAHNHSSNTS